jgi:UDP-N-acetylmuramoyl-L-alanyl-D-glutamate--2,6-diaminopimelate ligase
MMAAAKTTSADIRDGAIASSLGAALDALPARITGVTANSREARAGFLFLAYPGGARDGRDFIAKAIARGASAVAFDDVHFAWKAEWRVPHLAVPNLKAQASAIAGHVYRDPSQSLLMVGVTGTNGKTSVSQWVAHACQRTGRASAVIGTIGNGPVGRLAPSDNTTPDAVALQRTLREFADVHIDLCAMEVSSHGLDQRRVDAVKFDVAIFTNLTRDHLDYHGTMEAYGAAKAMLFAARGLKTAVINVDDAFGQVLADRVAARGIDVIRFACNGGSRRADLIGTDLSVTAGGLGFRVTGKFGSAQVESAILGAFNVSNLLAVAGALLAIGIPLSEAATVISDLAPVPGRMQTVRVGDDNFGDTNKPLVVVDYAHTPDALEKALSTVAAIVPDKGRLISVFGCGGNRDRGKRPQMGAISAKYADLTVVTSDNPRHEDPQLIIADIEPALSGATYRVIADRHQAIYEALNEADVNDIVLIAGKGHEDYQIVGDTKHHFSDVEEAREALAQWKGRRV